MAEKWWIEETKDFPCKDCPDRHLACHQDCERYIKSKNKQIEKNRQVADRRKRERDYHSVRVKRYVRLEHEKKGEF